MRLLFFVFLKGWGRGWKRDRNECLIDILYLILSKDEKEKLCCNGDEINSRFKTVTLIINHVVLCYLILFDLIIVCL